MCLLHTTRVSSLTLNVSLLYTNIPNNEGIEACTDILNTRDVQPPATDNIICLMFLFLYKNAFSFDNEHCLQVKGTAMNTHMAHCMRTSLWTVWRGGC